ncbi:MAG TPA: hypothetical protein VFQ61_27575 [Polyangiaceae bacterium]|nr:hypothetical protein [Polyangiaceae bacterium]
MSAQRTSARRTSAKLAAATGLCAALALFVSPACRRSPETAGVPSASASAAQRPPLDRLGNNELAPGEEALFGLRLPRGMTVQGRFKDSGLAIGDLPVATVVSYVKDHVEANHVELGATQTVFPSARVAGEANAPLLRIEIAAEAGVTRLHVRDMTPRPAPRLDGLSNDDLWRRAGFDRNGKPLHPKELE